MRESTRTGNSKIKKARIVIHARCTLFDLKNIPSEYHRNMSKHIRAMAWYTNPSKFEIILKRLRELSILHGTCQVNLADIHANYHKKILKAIESREH